MRALLFILLISAICLSCKKGAVIENQTGEKLEIYLLKSYRLVTGKCQIDEGTAVLQDTAMIKNQDILEYFQATYQFTLSDNSIKQLKALNDGTPFAVAVDKKVVYFGILKPSYSSSTCANSITMDYVGGYNKITMNLGYAGTDINIDDQRNNSLLITTLSNQGKLR